MAFDRDRFLKANQSNQEKGGLKNAKEGVYNVTLIDAALTTARSGRDQIVFCYQVDPPDELAGEKIWEYIGLDSDGGYAVLDVRLSQFGVKDTVTFIGDFENNLQKLINRTKARIQVKHVPNTNNPGQEFQQIRVQRLIENAFANEAPNYIPPPTQEQQTISSPATMPESTNDAPNILNESTILVNYQGKPEKCKVLNYMKPTGKLFVEFANTALGKSMVDVKDIISTQVTDPPPSLPQIQEVVEEIVEEVVEIAIQIGMNVKFSYNGKELSGTIHELIPEENSAKIRFTDPADKKLKALKLTVDKLTPIS